MFVTEIVAMVFFFAAGRVTSDLCADVLAAAATAMTAAVAVAGRVSAVSRRRAAFFLAVSLSRIRRRWFLDLACLTHPLLLPSPNIRIGKINQNLSKEVRHWGRAKFAFP
jgi:hypothetical protein